MTSDFELLTRHAVTGIWPAPPPAPGRSGLIPLPAYARSTPAFPRPQPRLCGATRTSRSNSPTPTLKARRPRLARRRRSRRPRDGLSGTVRRRRPALPAPAADPALPPPRKSSSRDPLQEGRRRGPHGARMRRPLTRTSDRRSNGRLCAPTRTRPSTRLPPSSRLIRAGQAAAWIRERQEAELAAHPQAPDEGRRIFRQRPAAVERGQDRRGASGAGDGPPRGGVANHPRLVARRRFRRAVGERHLARIRLFAHQGRPRLSR